MDFDPAALSPRDAYRLMISCGVAFETGVLSAAGFALDAHPATPIAQQRKKSAARSS